MTRWYMTSIRLICSLRFDILLLHSGNTIRTKLDCLLLYLDSGVQQNQCITNIYYSAIFDVVSYYGLLVFVYNMALSYWSSIKWHTGAEKVFQLIYTVLQLWFETITLNFETVFDILLLKKYLLVFDEI